MNDKEKIQEAFGWMEESLNKSLSPMKADDLVEAALKQLKETLHGYDFNNHHTNDMQFIFPAVEIGAETYAVIDNKQYKVIEFEGHTMIKNN